MHDDYTLKEIILALRKEQLRIVNELKKLKKFVNIAKEKDMFTINEFNQLIYVYWENLDLISKIFEILTGNWIDVINGVRLASRIKKDSLGNYYINDKLSINKEDNDAFRKQLMALLNDPFLKSLTINHEGFSFNPNDPILSFHYDKISCFMMCFNKENTIFYDAHDDIINTNLQYRNKSYQELVNELLALRFPKRYFKEYIQNIIDNSDERKKDIIIPDANFYHRKAQFYVNDERDAVVLIKK